MESSYSLAGFSLLASNQLVRSHCQSLSCSTTSPREQVWKKARKEKGKQPGDSGCFSLGSAISGCRNLDLKAAPVKNAFKNGSGPTAMAEVSKAFLQQYKDEEVASAIKKVFDRFVIKLKYDTSESENRLMANSLRPPVCYWISVDGAVVYVVV